MHHYNGESAMQLGSLWTCSAMHISPMAWEKSGNYEILEKVKEFYNNLSYFEC